MKEENRKPNKFIMMLVMIVFYFIALTVVVGGLILTPLHHFNILNLENHISFIAFYFLIISLILTAIAMTRYLNKEREN